jgi:hypothetical protein
MVALSTEALYSFGNFGVQRFSFGRFLEYNALALDVFGVQRFSFGQHKVIPSIAIGDLANEFHGY